MPVLSLFEQQQYEYGALGLAPGDPFFAGVERLNAAAGAEIVQLGRGALRVGAWVGVVRAGAWTLEILPKIDFAPSAPGEAAAGPPEAARQASAAANLLALLAYAAGLPLRALSPARLQTRPGGWTGLLTAFFAHSLREALAAGLPHDYVERADTLPVLRGRPDPARQARLPLPSAHRLAVTYADYTPDTPLNQVLRLAVEDLLPVTADAPTAALLADLRGRLGAVRLRPELRGGPLPAVTFDARTAPFRAAYQLAGLFLAGRAVSLRTGPQPAFAFVFDMNRLFERFTAGFLRRYQRFVWPEGWHGVQLWSQRSPGAPAYLARQAGRPVLRLRPDLVFARAGSAAPLLVGDTKYKDPGPSGAPAADAYQVLAYLLRLGCPRGLLLYPQPAGAAPARRVLRIDPPGGRPVQITAATINLRADLTRPAAMVEELRGLLQTAAGE